MTIANRWLPPETMARWQAAASGPERQVLACQRSRHEHGLDLQLVLDRARPGKLTTRRRAPVTVWQVKQPPTQPPRAAPTRRWPYLGPPQKLLLLAVPLCLFGSFLPWADTAFGTFGGLAGGGLWTLYAGVAGVPGAIVKRRLIARAHALVMGLVATVIPGWQLLRLLQLGGIGRAWLPGVGLVMVLGSGLMALNAARRLGRRPR